MSAGKRELLAELEAESRICIACHKQPRQLRCLHCDESTICKRCYKRGESLLCDGCQHMSESD